MSTAKCFSLAQERYAAVGVDVDHALKTLSQILISLHCWQGDDVGDAWLAEVKSYEKNVLSKR